MLGQSYFQLLSPLIFLVFSGGFMILWRYARDIASLRCFALSYFIGSCAMVVDFLRPLMSPYFASALLSILYLATAVTFCAGLYVLYNRRVPWKGMIAAATAVLLAFSWFRYFSDSLVWTSWTINAGTVALFAHTQLSLRHAVRNRVDRALHIVVGLSTTTLLVRTAIVLWYEGGSISNAEYAGSVLALTLQMVISVAALAVAGVLFVLYGMEIVHRLTRTGETDPLTGVLNRRGLENRLASVVHEGPAGSVTHAVVMADIDRFKCVNDTWGHDAGDAVIAALGRLLGEGARDSDFVVRWGGEEFLVVLVNTEAGTARLFAETVRTRLESLRHACLAGGSVTASFGIALWRNGQDLSGVCRQADAALYRAKRDGRNRVCVDKPEPPFAKAEAGAA